ncbi:hypothetical protein [Mycobacteroides franklinii]|uniref:hypothetical protein n=1 Tax=Mycobacteroides franklinii TaxID=948102 RepID=UPI0012FF98D8|nr:hypothetical protein [Mycobacteroides franklinii]
MDGRALGRLGGPRLGFRAALGFWADEAPGESGEAWLRLGDAELDEQIEVALVA